MTALNVTNTAAFKNSASEPLLSPFHNNLNANNLIQACRVLFHPNPKPESEVCEQRLKSLITSGRIKYDWIQDIIASEEVKP